MTTTRKSLLGLLLLIGLAGAILIAISWAPDRPVDQLKDRWAQPPSQFIEFDGMQVHVRDEGPRNELAPLVLLHGTSASLHTWQGWAEAVRDERRVVRFDLPGFGLTGPAPDNDYSIDRYSRFVAGMLEELDIQHAVLAGNSLGGQIAWETALLIPGKIEALVLVNSGGYHFEPESMPIGFRLAQIPGIAPLMNNLLPRSMIESSVREVYGDPAKVDEALVDRYYELTLREGNREALIERFQQSLASDDADARIRTLPQPTLIIWGGRDRLIPPAYAHRFNQDIANSELALFDLLGHVPHEEAPGMTVQVVEDFLERTESPASPTHDASE